MPDFTPRLSKQGMLNSKYWYSSTNPFYPTYGLPNCTCYAWGRFWEISDVVPHLPTGDGGEWWGRVEGYETGQTPQLGAVLCFNDPSGVYAGHVCVVEEILDNGDIITSNSGYSRSPGGYNDPLYFWTATNPVSTNYREGWEVSRGYNTQGFIYNPEQPVPPVPARRTGMPLWFYTLRKL